MVQTTKTSIQGFYSLKRSIAVFDNDVYIQYHTKLIYIVYRMTITINQSESQVYIQQYAGEMMYNGYILAKKSRDKR